MLALPTPEAPADCWLPVEAGARADAPLRPRLSSPALGTEEEEAGSGGVGGQGSGGGAARS